MSSRWYPVAAVGDIPKNEGRKVTYDELEVAVFNLGTDYLAVDNRCPHKQGPLADGIISGRNVFCPLHALKISLETGCSATGPECVKTYPAKVIDGRICIAFLEGKG